MNTDKLEEIRANIYKWKGGDSTILTTPLSFLIDEILKLNKRVEYLESIEYNVDEEGRIYVKR